MPRGDGTGPMGMGPMIGRGAGFCAGFTAPGYSNQAGFGFDRGRGFRRMFYATGLPGWARHKDPNIKGFVPVADKKEFLKRQAKLLESRLNNITKRLKELESDTEE